MRASALSVAILSAFAASLAAGAAQAGDVEIYGIIDTGLNYQHVDADTQEDATNQLQMKSSQSIPNRWGMRGTESLANGLKVGFMLEGQFSSDTGEMTGGRLFHRTAQVSLTSQSLGTIALGRSGALRSGFGSTGLWAVKINPFSSSWGDYMIGNKYIMPGGFKAVDNAITYQSPVMSGLQLHAQYSMKIDKNEDQVENKASSDRQWGLGATYTQGPVHVVAVLDSVMYANSEETDDYDDSLAFSLGGTYNFGFMKLYVSGMYFKGMKQTEFQGHVFSGSNDIASGASYKGYSVQTGVDVPLWGGTAKANIAWMDAKVDQKVTFNEVNDEDIDRFGIAVGYSYPLSKRTSLYAGAGYVRDTSNIDGREPSAIEAVSGMVVRF
mgnify:CR=1 FL=1